MEHPLAIIIPAYKVNFLAKTLDSIAKQTCSDFTLYIGDDNSPFQLESVVEQYKDKINIVYCRFDDNWGSKRLVSQWERCIALSQGEPLIWLFSDDDIMPQDAVERVIAAAKERNFKDCFFRFPLSLIDADDRVVASNPVIQMFTTGYQFMLDKLEGKITSAACEYVFSRSLYEKSGGFIDFPLAWCSDDATWIKFAEYTGIDALMGRPVYWRNVSGSNISNLTGYNVEKMEATSLFITWLSQHYGKKLNNKEFYKALRHYVRIVLTCSLHRKYTNRQLFDLCKSIGKIRYNLAVYVFLKNVRIGSLK